MIMKPFRNEWQVATGKWQAERGVPCSRRPLVPRPSPLLQGGGITLTEILISIMILGIGLVSLATLFPIGLLRLRDAQRWSRSATLLQTAASDAVSRGLFGSQTFQYADLLNYQYRLTPWYNSTIMANGYPGNTCHPPADPPSYNPLLT